MTADDLKRKRERLGWTQAELARRLDVTTLTIKRYESGRSPVPRTVDLALRELERQER